MGGLWSKDETDKDESSKSKKRKKGQHGGPIAKTQVLASPVIWKRTSSMFFDEDGFFAHEFYKEQQVSCDQVARWVMKRIYTNLTPEGEVKLRIPRLHVDYHVVMWENSQQPTIATEQ